MKQIRTTLLAAHPAIALIIHNDVTSHGVHFITIASEQSLQVNRQRKLTLLQF